MSIMLWEVKAYRVNRSLSGLLKLFDNLFCPNDDTANEQANRPELHMLWRTSYYHPD